MTDNKITKALDCCRAVNGQCSECPYRSNRTCIGILHKDALYLINRQKAEIERVQKESIGNCGLAIAMRSDHNLEGDCHYCIDTFKAVAIKEFAETVKKAFPSIAGAIDYFVKERVSEV